MTRFRRVDSRREQERVVDEFVTKGYKITQQGQYTAKVKEKDWGDVTTHGFIAILAFVASAFLFDVSGVSAGAVWVVVIAANLTYAVFSRQTAEEVVIKIENEEAP